MEKFNYSTEEMYCGRGNEKIYGLLYRPDGAEKRPVMIMSHGYNSSHAHMTDVAEGLAERGVIVYAYDFCGGSTISKSTGSPLDMSIMTEQSDLRAVIAAVSELKAADTRRIYLYGESQGGYVSAITAAESAENIAGLFLLYPALCIPDDWSGRSDCPERLDVMGMTLSRKFYEELPRYELFERLSHFEKPVHIFHGDADGLVNISYAERAAKSFPKAKLDVFEGEGHGFGGGARRKMLGMILDDLGLL